MSAPLEINPYVKNIQQLQSQKLARRSEQIQEDIRRGSITSFKEVIDVSSGNPHSGGLRPLTFVRQVLAACFYPELLDSDGLKADVKQRAEKLLKTCVGGSVGCYTNTAGIPEVIHGITEFISRRDGGVPCDPQNIFISSGSQWCLSNILKVLVNTKSSLPCAVLSPVPCYPTTLMSLRAQGGLHVPYRLTEEGGWVLKGAELQRALQSAQGVSNPVALYVVNPGNPAGLVQSRASIQEVIRFVYENRLFLLADEVYQDCVYGENSCFVSYKQVLMEMGPPYSHSVELASFHSASKGVIGECGLRGGYVELVNVDQAVMDYIYKMFSLDSCASVSGQMVLDLMTNPPQPGEPSYPLYCQEKEEIRRTLVHNALKATEAMNLLLGFSCQPVEGGAFMFPRVDLPQRAIQRAQEAELPADMFYCMRLLEEAGLMVIPGCDYQQEEGTYHIRALVI
ncbi:alanine aminotransferase 1-like isoform X2 [Gouania willdenowi]|uniref:alanine aminotransferase 1-like isoform X2 n=1 Tax=Gouania willdenowi TaxID=441366 RepID=UPI00105414D5|nr:alanine aminotransferase 1-like isoform X2 [Gouania willdenowi]